MAGKKISVIIPAYNVESYIRRCLDSLVNQTYDNLELIVVNDGSTDRTGEIIHEYEERFPEKVRVFDRENGGQADARNFGLTKAAGEYIGFVDSDDFVSATMYEKLYREAERTGCDLVTCGFYGCDDATGEITVYQAGYRGEFNQSIYENPKLLRTNSPHPCNKLYSRELLDRAHFHFEKGIIFEDLCAVYSLFLDVKKVGRVHEKLYYYIKGRKGSTLNTFDKRHGQIIDSLTILNRNYRERGMFERFYDTLLFFNIRHIYARFDEMEKYQDESFREEYTDRAYGHLDQWFPGWRESKEYADYLAGGADEAEEEKEPEEETGAPAESAPDKECAGKPDGQDGRQGQQEGRAKASGKAKRRAEVFDEIRAEREIAGHTVLIECYHGNDVRGGGYFIGEMLARTGGYSVFMAVADDRKEELFRRQFGERWEFVDMRTDRYVELLATAEYVVTNRAFAGFYRKRRGQKFIFTDFMPVADAQGKAVTYGRRDMQGIQFCLAQADSILFAEELRGEFAPLLEQYHMREVCEGKGTFVPIRDFLRGWNDMVSPSGADPSVTTIAYTPSPKEFPGLKDRKNYLFLSDLKKKLTQLDERLGDGQRLLVCFPRIVRRRFQKNIWKHIEFMPDDAEPSLILSRCQALIGEYGDEPYLMRALGKPVCRLVTDGEDRRWSHGASEMPGDVCETFHSVEEVGDWLERVSSERAEAQEVPTRNRLDGYVERFSRTRRRRNKRTGRKVVYVPAVSGKEELDSFLQKYDLRTSLFFIEKNRLGDDMAAWLSAWGPELRYIVILRSLVVSRGESRQIKYKLTTKEKLREKRDKERYGA